ncbi:PREDICTED: uncharacterized protein LOC109347026 [Lupinus angustifolius]|uniref:uncharacterized protein LOC109347026 n=1 Tax=Lupinus angustifolius TaxID=3871 RepID=UPI00092E9F08|nr:PREDICTED: uncharacterized protein LOC109347026 [Lupinus angustifolius]
MYHKTLGGNLAIKLDVKKAFDTIDWKFLKDTLHAFGFASSFMYWIDVILKSARLSILVNGHSVGFFHCKRGVRQGDPLSPLLFCLAEDVISRGLSKLLDNGKFRSIVGPRIATPSHVLYADDILLFYRGIKRELFAIKDLFNDYAKVLGQCLNLNKCKFFSTQATPRKISKLTAWLGFGVGSLLFNYLGVPVFKGKPKAIHLQPIADRIINKLASWPVNLLKKLDCCIRNFIWSGDTKVKKLVTIAWDKISSFLVAKIPDYITDSAWIIPSWMSRNHPEVCHKILRTPIPTSNLPDKLAWQHTSDGILNSKEAYNYIKRAQAQDHLCNSIWSIAIPPSKSFVTWRLLKDRMSIDLKIRGLALPSIATFLRYPIDHASIKSLLSISASWSPQLQQVLISAIVNSIAVIWHCRNKSRFDNLHINSAQAIQMIKLNTSFTSNFTKLCAKPSLQEFSILRAFQVTAKYNKAPAISEVN